MYIEQMYTNCLAEAAYYIESEGEAVIIDPIRETEPYTDKLQRRSAKLKYVFETHFHADFVSGHIDLAAKTGALIVFGPKAETNYTIYSAKDEEVFTVGKLKIKLLHTPGHTPESSCFLLYDEKGKEHALFTGDTLFVNDVGRPDLLDGTMSKEELAAMLYDSLNKKIKPLPDNVIIYPAHGPGSACGKNIGEETWSTLGVQKRTNYALQEMPKDEFINAITEGLSAPPLYFFKDAEINKSGYENIESVMKRNLKPLTVSEFKNAMNEGAHVLDTRLAENFEKGFLKGSLNIGLNGQFAIWAGTLLDVSKPLLIITEEETAKESIQRLARVGFENIRGYLQGGINSWIEEGETIEKIQTCTAKELAGQLKKSPQQILDVRKENEFENGHVKNATHISLNMLQKEVSRLDKSKTYYVHCAGGYRSMIAASILKAAGINHVVNIYGGFAKLSETDVPLELPDKHIHN